MDVVSCRESILDLRGGDKMMDACISSLGHGCGELQTSILDLRACDKVIDACISSLGHGYGELQTSILDLRGGDKVIDACISSLGHDCFLEFFNNSCARNIQIMILNGDRERQ